MYVILYTNFAFDVSSPALVFSILKEHHPSSSFRRFVIALVFLCYFNFGICFVSKTGCSPYIFSFVLNLVQIL